MILPVEIFIEIGELVNLYIKKPVSARNFHN